MKKKAFQKKKTINSKLTEEQAEIAKISLSNAVIQSLGFNPECSYTIQQNVYHSDLKEIPTNLFALQESVIFISDNLKNELYNCPKYIYKIENNEIIKTSKENKISNKTIRTIYHIVGKTKLGYVPFKLIITANPKRADYYRVDKIEDYETMKSLFAVQLQGKDFLILDRIDDEKSLCHDNKYFNSKKRIFESLPTNRVVYGAHKHQYDEEEMLFSFKKCIDSLESRNYKNKDFLNFKILKELDATEIKKLSYDELFSSYLFDANVSCFSNFDEDKPLSEIFEKCHKIEKKFYDQFKPNDEFERKLLKLFITNENINKMSTTKQSFYNCGFDHLIK